MARSCKPVDNLHAHCEDTADHVTFNYTQMFYFSIKRLIKYKNALKIKLPFNTSEQNTA